MQSALLFRAHRSDVNKDFSPRTSTWVLESEVLVLVLDLGTQDLGAKDHEQDKDFTRKDKDQDLSTRTRTRTRT